MSFINILENELTSLKMSAEQKRVFKDLESMDWIMKESSGNGNPVVQKPNTNVSFEITSEGKLEEVAE